MNGGSGARKTRHFVLVHRYFWPDTPTYAHILKEIAIRLGQEGHRVTVLTCQPSYNRAVVERAPSCETLAAGVEVRRWPVVDDRKSNVRKAVNLVQFCTRLMVARRRLGKVDAVMAASTPPIAVAKVASWLALLAGSKFVYHKQDIYPEVVVASGILQRPRLTRFLRWLDARTERNASRTVVLSRDMAETVHGRGDHQSSVAIINNFDPWVLETSPSDTDMGSVESRGGEGLNVAFAGNLGRFQNLRTVVNAALELRSETDITFHFFGDGALRNQIEQELQSGDANARFYGYQSPEDVAEFLYRRADVGLVSLEPGVIRAAYPSKTMSYLRQGCPVIALVESSTELAESLSATGAGVQVDPTDGRSLASAMRRLRSDREFLVQARKAAQRVYDEQFDRTRQLDAWVRLFEDVSGEAPK